MGYATLAVTDRREWGTELARLRLGDGRRPVAGEGVVDRGPDLGAVLPGGADAFRPRTPARRPAPAPPGPARQFGYRTARQFRYPYKTHYADFGYPVPGARSPAAQGAAGPVRHIPVRYLSLPAQMGLALPGMARAQTPALSGYHQGVPRKGPTVRSPRSAGACAPRRAKRQTAVITPRLPRTGPPAPFWTRLSKARPAISGGPPAAPGRQQKAARGGAQPAPPSGSRMATPGPLAWPPARARLRRGPTGPVP
jgi:hypothetical protein